MANGKALILGATGAQGGSVARSCLENGVRVRTLTRNPSGDVAGRLASRGVEVLGGDLRDTSGLTRAMQGCDWVFGVTNFWEHGALEVEHGRNIVDAALEAKVPHLILSTLESTRAGSGGDIDVPHWESKAEIERYARLSGAPCTFAHVSFYFENFSIFGLHEQPDGSLQFGFPQGKTPLAGIGIEDVGPAITALAREAQAPRGERIGLVGEELRGDEYAAAFSEALGRVVRYDDVPSDIFRSRPFPGGPELTAMFDYTRRFVPSRAHDVKTTRRLHPKARTFAQWAREHAGLLAGAIRRAS